MSENKFENPIIEPEEKWEKELSPEEVEQYVGDMGEYFEQTKKNIEEIKELMATEQDEEKKQKMAEKLADWEGQLAEWDGDYEPATKEEELEIKTRPHKGE